MIDDTFSLENFRGVVRLFPLPNLVMFPHVVQPFHIFESRYVEMLEASLKDDHLIATALLRPGWEAEYDGRPPIEPIVCLGRVMSHAPVKDGRYNILLGGIARGMIVRELAPRCSFREAEIEILASVEPPDLNDPEVLQLHATLVQCFRKFLPESMPSQQQLDEILTQPAQLGTLADLVSYSLPLELPYRQMLLSEIDVLQRTRLLLAQLERQLEGPSGERPFPPEFSLN